MSVGGKVYAINKWLDGMVNVVVEDQITEECIARTAVNLEKNGDSLTVQHGDTVWWQGRHAYWSTKDGSIHDRKIPRIGYSYSVPV